MHAKLSPGQRAMFEVALSKGDVAIKTAENAAKLGLEAGRSLFDQSATLTRVAIHLEAVTGSRAAGQLLRSAASHGAIGGAIRILGGAAFFVITEIGLHSGEAR
jgi:hypothetical protein